MLIAAAALITAHVIPAPGSTEQARLEARTGYTPKSGLKNADSEPATDAMELVSPGIPAQRNSRTSCRTGGRSPRFRQGHSLRILTGNRALFASSGVSAAR